MQIYLQRHIPTVYATKPVHASRCIVKVLYLRFLPIHFSCDGVYLTLNFVSSPLSRPSIEKIFASGWNESSFFFGATEEYLTLSSTRAERSEISRALAYPLSDRCAVGSSLAKNNDPEDSTSMNSSSLLSSSGLAVSEDGFDDITATYDSDSFVRSELCNPIYALPSLLRGTLEYPFRNHLALLTIRKTEKAMLLLSVSSILFQDVGMA